VGYEEGGQLTEKVRRRPYSVVLFDEIEKAHVDVFNMLLQIMEEGRLTDSTGRNVDFRNTIIIMTSNVGTDLLRSQAPLGFRKARDGAAGLREALLGEVEKLFRPEFLNRVDDIIIFRPLARADLEAIVHLEVKAVEERMARKGVRIALSREALDFLIDQGSDPDFGARPLKRAIERRIEDPLSEGLLRGEFKDAREIRIEVRDGSLWFRALKGTPINRAA
jgi:ATP-dependent Clp protease ATP-binding subunit ClpC